MAEKKQLVLLQLIDAKRVQTFDIDKSEFIIGRGDTSAVPISDHAISREHFKVKLENNLIQIQDLNSSNGTYVEGIKLNPHEYAPVRDTYVISFANAKIKIKLKIIEVSAEIANEVNELEKKSENPPIVVDLSAFPKTEQDFKHNFKNVGLHLPKYKNASEHAQEIIKEAEYIKHSIIKSAEVFKVKSLNEAKMQSRQATEEAYGEYQKMVDHLLDETRRELKRLKTETEIMLDNKRLQANDEIQNLWSEHQELIRKDKEKQLEVIEKENIIKLELSIEKMKSDMFSERNRLITEAENEILQKKKTYQVEFENEKAEHLSRIKLYSEELNKIQTNIAQCEKMYKDNRTLKDDSELELSKVLSHLKQENENLEYATKQYNETLELHKNIELELSQFAQTKSNWLNEQEKAEALLEETNKQWNAAKIKHEQERDDLNRIYSNLIEKRNQIEEQIKHISKTHEDAKIKIKEEVENEYKILKEIEAKKFDDYKSNELKELKKIRDDHSNSIKKFSVDLSQEIATKIELLAKKNDLPFDFEKNFELINSVIQVKSAISTGSESKHAEQLDGWKKRKQKENFQLMTRGFVAGLVIVFFGNYAYKRLNVDPVQEEMARMLVERKQRESENIFVPQKTNQYYDSYVDATLYTNNFTEVYLNDDVQQEWVNYATKYFLRQWKVEEEKVIKVISNSKALVQSIDEQRGTLHKDRIKSELEKLKATEQESVQGQANILGTNVKYEAYKKLEKDFFLQRVQKRVPANK